MSKEDEMRILRNFLSWMTKAYRKRNQNWCVVRDVLLDGTSTAGSTSCKQKCMELGIDPYGYDLESEG